tara:strand:- start:9 stop:722 length:714 start_codon:yes stop_codon:yes gene_type:complete
MNSSKEKLRRLITESITRQIKKKVNEAMYNPELRLKRYKKAERLLAQLPEETKQRFNELLNSSNSDDVRQAEEFINQLAEYPAGFSYEEDSEELEKYRHSRLFNVFPELSDIWYENKNLYNKFIHLFMSNSTIYIRLNLGLWPGGYPIERGSGVNQVINDTGRIDLDKIDLDTISIDSLECSHDLLITLSNYINFCPLKLSNMDISNILKYGKDKAELHDRLLKYVISRKYKATIDN